MKTKILTQRERKRIHGYLQSDGERITAVRQLVTRIRRYLPEIEKDLALVKELLAAYGKVKGEKARS